MAYKRKIIQVPHGAAKRIAKDQKCGLTTVYAALNYTSHSESAERIRRLATTCYGGIETTKTYL
jgi:hypothetical protein